MRLDFSTLRQPTVNMRGQVGTLGTPATTRVSVSPRTQSEVGTTGDKWGNDGTGVICSCKFLRFVPICPQLSPGGECRKTQCWRGVPNVPSVPIENAQISIGTVSVATAPAQSGFRIHGLSVSHTPVCQLPRGIRTFALVCSFQVSVSVRPERLSAAGTTRDTGHHSRYVPRSSFSPPRHAAFALMALAAASRFIGLSHRSHGPGCARLRIG